MNQEKILLEEEKLYEKLLNRISDRSSNEYKRIYRKLYYIRNMSIIKEYQKKYYRTKKKPRAYYAPPLTGDNVEKFKVIRKPVTLVFD